MDDERLVRTFEAAELPEGGFHHADHVRVAWRYLQRLALGEAMARFTVALKRFAAARGKPELYHDTITVAYMLLINERLEAVGRGASWDDFARRNADLLAWRPSALDRYYTSDTLWSERARRSFVMPDRLSP
jgi:hypothetical protein